MEKSTKLFAPIKPPKAWSLIQAQSLKLAACFLFLSLIKGRLVLAAQIKCVASDFTELCVGTLGLENPLSPLYGGKKKQVTCPSPPMLCGR